MIFVFVLLALLLAAFIILGIKSYYYEELWWGAAILTGIALVIAFFMSFKWHIGTDQYTGYIYSAETAFGYTTGHLRFSENAGEDTQPSFCVIDAEQGDLVRSLAGSGKKVKVTVSSRGVFFSNNPFACSGNTSIEIME